MAARRTDTNGQKNLIIYTYNNLFLIKYAVILNYAHSDIQIL